MLGDPSTTPPVPLTDDDTSVGTGSQDVGKLTLSVDIVAACPATAADLVELVRGYYEANLARGGGQNWLRVLIAFGDETHDTLQPYTAAEARAGEARWSGWAPVRIELERLDTCADNNPPPPPPKPVVAIAGAAGGTEGAPVTFTVTASPAPAAGLAVGVTVATTGDFGYGTAPTSVTIPTSGTATVTITTADDSADEPDGTVTMTLNAGSDYTIGAPSTQTATVTDDDDPPVAVEQDDPDDPDEPVLAACGAALPTLSISNPTASRSDQSVDFEVSLSCIPANSPTILLTPVRDGSIASNMFVALSAQQTSATVTVTVGTEDRLGLALAWNQGLANDKAQGNVVYTD
ncbi:MAG: hypothetical protein OXL98_08925 [Acidimicrobiaceae bacterium]|nr:hypothetical protein [Acidimicrobiaceae bacterium]